MGSGHARPELLKEKESDRGDTNASSVYEAVSSWQIYHFHDTGKTAAMRRSETIDDNRYLRFDAANIAPFLFCLQSAEKDVYSRIVDTIRLVAPFFDDFVLIPDKN
ncbi:MAG: recombinase RecF, partial [Candidatus Electrothrix sp. AR1]|nr:recombinase RecF [Candidatus Electrothrix sp. AR1]